MKKPKELKGKKIAIIGLGASQIDFIIGLENSKQWDEVWVINSAVAAYDYDRVFMMDPASRYLDTEDAGTQTEVMRRLLPSVTKPIYSCEKDDRVPAIVEYPLAEVDFSYKENIHFAEAGRACLEFWISKCIDAKIKIGVSPRSTLLDSNVPVTERLYGYHRLADPLVAMASPEGDWILCPRSQLSTMVQKHNLETIKMPTSPEPYKG